MDASIAAALIGAAATLAAAALTVLFLRGGAKDPPPPIAPHQAAGPQETTTPPHGQERSHPLLDLRDLREALDELVEEHGGFTDIDYDGRRNELRLRFRWRAWNRSPWTARRAGAGGHPPIFFEFFAPKDWPGGGPLELKLLLGRTPDGVPSRLLGIAEANPLFDTRQKPWPDGSRAIFRRDILPTSVRPTARYARLRQEWNLFVETDLPRLISAFEQPLSAQPPR